MDVRRVSTRAGGAFAILALGGLLSSGVAQGAAKITFPFTGSEQTFRVPAKVKKVSVLAIGGRGGTGASSVNPGGDGAIARGSFRAKPGQVLYILVGGNGGNATAGGGGAGGFNGGGAGANSGSLQFGKGGGGGGGASDIRTVPSSLGAASLASRLMIAAGGGGSGGSNFGGGGGGRGGTAGTTLTNNTGLNGGNGGGGPGGIGGFGATPTAPGAGGANGSPGFLGSGGAGGPSAMGVAAGTGGGGGGGAFGGGGGGTGAGGTSDGGGGGGGSSAFAGLVSGFSEGPDTTGVPRVRITPKCKKGFVFKTIKRKGKKKRRCVKFKKKT